MADDGFVQGAPDSTGKKVESKEITRPDGVLVERQRVEAPYLQKLSELLAAQIVETRVTNTLLARALDMGTDELDDLRADATGITEC